MIKSVCLVNILAEGNPSLFYSAGQTLSLILMLLMTIDKRIRNDIFRVPKTLLLRPRVLGQFYLDKVLESGKLS